MGAIELAERLFTMAAILAVFPGIPVSLCLRAHRRVIDNEARAERRQKASVGVARRVRRLSDEAPAYPWGDPRADPLADTQAYRQLIESAPASPLVDGGTFVDQLAEQDYRLGSVYLRTAAGPWSDTGIVGPDPDTSARIRTANRRAGRDQT